MPNHTKGFTLIELLIVVTLIGILSGIVIAVINPTVLANRAKDGVRAGNIAKIAQSFEAYNAAEGSYPADQTTLQTTSQYIKAWPSDATYTYAYISEGGGAFTTACVSVAMATAPTTYFKYITDYNATYTTGGSGLTASDVIGKVMKSCSIACSSAATGNDLNGCAKL